jgi:hypothetical protein
LFDIIHDPLGAPASRVPYPGLPALPPLDRHPLQVNTYTAQPLKLDPAPYTISFSIPATGTFPFLAAACPTVPSSCR